MRSREVKWWGATVVMVAVMAWAMPAALGQGVDQQISDLRHQLEQLEEAAEDDMGEADFARAHQWLDEAEQRHSRGRSSGVEQRIRRVDHTLDLLRAQMEITNIERSIESQRDAYENMVQQTEELREDIARLETQKEERKRELERIQSDD